MVTLDDLKAVKKALDHVVALEENLAAVQTRCTDLIQENRRLNKELAKADLTVNAQIRWISQLEEELSEFKPALEPERDDGDHVRGRVIE